MCLLAFEKTSMCRKFENRGVKHKTTVYDKGTQFFSAHPIPSNGTIMDVMKGSDVLNHAHTVVS